MIPNGPSTEIVGIQGPKPRGSFRRLGVPYFGFLMRRILLFRVLYYGPLLSETPMSEYGIWDLKLKSVGTWV